MKKVVLIILSATLLSSFFSNLLFGCTVAVVSGKATADGRPLLWKNRDTSHEANRVMFFQGEKYYFIAVVNSEDIEGEKIWSGVNSAGFCIMNSLSYNVNRDEKEEDKSGEEEGPEKYGEGTLMKRALEICATVDDFEQLLKGTADGREVDANFGVIDAEGGAAFFETEDTRFVRFDADDPRVAPEGYIVRTNFSNVGEPSDGAGYIRYDRTSKLFHEAVSTSGRISVDWLMTTGSRDMVNGLTGVDPLAGPLPAHSRDHRYYYMADSTARNSAVSTTIFQGVKPGEGPAGTIMWTRLGHPLCSVALPLWAEAGDNLGISGGSSDSPIDLFALYWHDRIFPLNGGSRDKYLDLAVVANRSGDGVLGRLIGIEERIIAETRKRLEGAAADRETLTRIQMKIDELAREALKNEFPEAAAAAGL